MNCYLRLENVISRCVPFSCYKKRPPLFLYLVNLSLFSPGLSCNLLFSCCSLQLFHVAATELLEIISVSAKYIAGYTGYLPEHHPPLVRTKLSHIYIMFNPLVKPDCGLYRCLYSAKYGDNKPHFMIAPKKSLTFFNFSGRT
jgi:hypothetical protein